MSELAKTASGEGALALRLKSKIKSRPGRIACDGIFRGLESFWILVKIMVPVYIAVTFLSFTPVLPAIADFFYPYMQVFGLPGGAALAIVLGNTVNIYAALGVIASLGMNSEQITTIAVMLGISHSLPLETAIFRKMKTNYMAILLLRLGCSISVGLIFKLLVY